MRSIIYILFLFIAPMLQHSRILQAQENDFQMRIIADNGNNNISFGDDDYNNNNSKKNLDNYLKYSGYIELSHDEEDITYISPGGYFEISKVAFGNTRKIVIESNYEGIISKKYYEGKSEKDFNSQGKQWLKDVLPQVIRESGVAAEYRVKTIYRNEGMSGLLDEISRINRYSSTARNLYFVIMVDKLKLSSNDLSMAIPEMRIIRSNSTKGSLMRQIIAKYQLSESNKTAVLKTTLTLDYSTERGSVLRKFNPVLEETPRMLDVYFEIIERIIKNTEKGTTLRDLMQSRKLSDNTYKRIFESLSSCSSEREKGAVLISATNYMPLNDDVVNAYYRAVEEMNPKYTVLISEVLDALYHKQMNVTSVRPESKTMLLQMLRTAQRNSSNNSPKALALRRTNRMTVIDNELFSAYASCLNSMTAVLDQYNVLLDLIEVRKKLDNRTTEMILDATYIMVQNDKQHPAAAILREILDKMPAEEDLIDQYFNVVDRMDQNGTIEEVLRTINSHERFAHNPQVVLRTIEAVDRIKVDIEKATTLKMLKKDVKSNQQKQAYRYAERTIKLDYFKRQLRIEEVAYIL